MARWLHRATRTRTTTNFVSVNVGSGDGDTESCTLKRSFRCRRFEPLRPRTALLLCAWAASLGAYCCGLFVGWSSHATAAHGVLQSKVNARARAFGAPVHGGWFVGVFWYKLCVLRIIMTSWSSINLCILHLYTQYSADELDQIVARLPLGAAAGALAAQMWWPHAGTKLACIAACLVMCTSTIGLFVE